MKIESFIVRGIVATFVLVSSVGTSFAYNDLPELPPPPPGWVPPPRQTEQSVTQDVAKQITQRFNDATGGTPGGLLSREQARTAGWGFVSDHFSEIDRSGSGYVRLDDVLRFVAERTPQSFMRMRGEAKQGQQP